MTRSVTRQPNSPSHAEEQEILQFARSPACGWRRHSPVALPFPDESFDAVLSSGTLEHVVDPDASLEEISRILRPNGWLIIYNLPNRYSWIEFIGRFRGTVRERCYDLRQARRWIADHGFQVGFARHDNILPCTFKGLPDHLRVLLQTITTPLDALDRIAGRIPPLSMLSTNLTLFCRKGVPVVRS